ncbi:hypothetical protein A9Q90_09060 [Gammaproteobacteria bacterium 54_18_T64]|nr:hypothetical protein A9Q90_09060 [Gammaproteobacteria bacterium 54_18_T64]
MSTNLNRESSRGYALITGAIGGLGTAMTKQLISEGIPVIGCDRKADELDAWRNRELSEEQSKMVTLFPLDITKEELVQELATELEQRGIHIAYLINNAGIQGPGKAWEMDTKTWDRVVKVNMYGTFFLCRAFSKQMLEAGFGRILNFASLAAYNPPRDWGSYAAAKAGVLGYTRSLALDLAPNGVTVNVIVPGLIMHEGLRETITDRFVEKMEEAVPMKRSGKPEEIAAAASFFMSEGSSFVTGQTMHVNGGMFLPG